MASAFVHSSCSNFETTPCSQDAKRTQAAARGEIEIPGSKSPIRDGYSLRWIQIMSAYTPPAVLTTVTRGSYSTSTGGKNSRISRVYLTWLTNELVCSYLFQSKRANLICLMPTIYNMSIK